MSNEESNMMEELMPTEMNGEAIAQEHHQNGSGKSGGDRDSKKRKYDDYDRNGHSSKRKSSGGDEVHVKIMIPSSAAGGVIGRGGEKIAQIQKDANVRMKMSKSSDHYPNTNERVCLVIGSVSSVLKAYEYINERMQEKSDSRSSSDDDRLSYIKLLIPNATAGLLIGKGGSYIKQIKDESGAFVQISSKSTDLPERIVTIEGEFEKRTKALSMVVKKISEDPQHNTIPHLDYGKFSQSNSDHAGSSQSNSSSSSSQAGSSSGKCDFNAAATYLAGLGNLALLIINCGGSFQMTAENLKSSLRNTGYSSTASMEIIDAITVLMSYGLITKIPPTQILGQSLANLGGFGNTGSAGLNPNAANLLQILSSSLSKR